jgi:hypothetical protein
LLTIANHRLLHWPIVKMACDVYYWLKSDSTSYFKAHMNNM